MITFAKTHLFYILLIAGGVISFHVWLTEHDARVQAENTIKVSEVKIKTLQDQITATNAAVTQKTAVVTRIVKAAVTPAQVVSAVPQLTNLPLSTRIAPGLGANEVAVDATALIQLAGEAKTAEVQLAGLQQNYTACQAIVTEVKNEVAALKKKPKFFKRLESVAKEVGVGIGIGFFLAKGKL